MHADVAYEPVISDTTVQSGLSETILGGIELIGENRSRNKSIQAAD